MKQSTSENYISERFDDMAEELHLAGKVNGLVTYPIFRKIVIERIIKPKNYVCLDLMDIKYVCEVGYTLDALVFKMTDNRTNCIRAAIQRLQKIHEGMTLSAMICNIPVHNSVDTESYARALQPILYEYEKKMFFGLYIPEETDSIGVIIAAFVRANTENCFAHTSK